MSTVSALIRSMRPKQWTKNLLVFAPIIFAGRLVEPRDLLEVVAALAILSGVSGAVYIFNDVRDAEGDRLHEKKRTRPIAAGELSPGTAIAFGAVVLGIGLAAAFALSPSLGIVVLAYFVLQLTYTLVLKHKVILDVFAIAAGFVLRAVAGAVVIGVPSSPWLLLCVSLLALFLALAKRRHEILLLEDEAGGHRVALEEYSASLIDEMISTVTAATVVSYALYTFTDPRTAQFYTVAGQTPWMMLTVPFVVYGLFRYLYLMHQKNLGGSPEDILVSDGPLVIDIALWLAAVAAVIYFT